MHFTLMLDVYKFDNTDKLAQIILRYTEGAYDSI